MSMSDSGQILSTEFSPQSYAKILGVRVHAVTVDILLRQAIQWAKEETQRTILYTNVHVLNTAYHDANLRNTLNSADLVYCDGEGVRLASHLVKQPLPERMTGADLLLPICEACEKAQVRLYFLGCREGIASRAGELMKEVCPHIAIGSHHGYLSDPHISKHAIQSVNDFGPGLVLVGMGTPTQERWITENRDKLEVPVVWAVGALFDFIAGVQPRGPNWMISHGLEWIFRLWSDPQRLWKRYVVGNPLFLWRVFKQKWNLAKMSEP